MKDQQITEIGYSEEEKKWRDCVVEDFRNHRRRIRDLETSTFVISFYLIVITTALILEKLL